MVEGVIPVGTNLPVYQSVEDYPEVIAELMEKFPTKSREDIQKAINEFIQQQLQTQNPDAPIDPQKMLQEITRIFTAEIAAQTLNEIRKELEKINLNTSLGVTDLAGLLDTYSSGGIEVTDRMFLMLLWHFLQGEIEEAIGKESNVVATANKELQEKEFKEYVDKKLEEIAQANKAGFWNKFLKWAGVVASLVAAAVACVVAAVAIATGVGAAAGVALIAAAVILTTLAVAGAVSAVLDECGVQWTLGQGLGKAIAKLINAFGGDVDEDKFAKWFAFGLQMTLTVVAIALSFGAAAGSGVASAASMATKAGEAAVTTTSKLLTTLNSAANIMKIVSGGLAVGTGLIQVGAAVNNYQLAQMQAALLELLALLEQLGETRQLDQDLTARILQIIFQAMRGNVAESWDTLLQDIQNVTGMNLNKA